MERIKDFIRRCGDFLRDHEDRLWYIVEKSIPFIIVVVISVGIGWVWHYKQSQKEMDSLKRQNVHNEERMNILYGRVDALLDATLIVNRNKIIESREEICDKTIELLTSLGEDKTNDNHKPSR